MKVKMKQQKSNLLAEEKMQIALRIKLKRNNITKSAFLIIMIINPFILYYISLINYLELYYIIINKINNIIKISNIMKYI